MIDHFLEKKYNIRHKYWFIDNFVVCEVSGEYLGQICKFRKELCVYDIASAKCDIIEITMDDLKNYILKFISEKLDNNTLNVL